MLFISKNQVRLLFLLREGHKNIMLSSSKPQLCDPLIEPLNDCTAIMIYCLEKGRLASIVGSLEGSVGPLKFTQYSDLFARRRLAEGTWPVGGAAFFAPSLPVQVSQSWVWVGGRQLLEVQGGNPGPLVAPTRVSVW